MTIEEVSNYLKVSKETIYKMSQQNKIPAIKVGTQWRFHKDAIDKWLEQQANELSTALKTNIPQQEQNNG